MNPSLEHVGTLYLIEPSMTGTWILRRFEVVQPMAEAQTPEEIKEEAFERLPGFAPCTLRALLDPIEEWVVEDIDGSWRKVEKDPEEPNA